jgi:hypothetical protein
MVKMAIGSQFLREGNTFAKSMWLHLVDKLAGWLAEAIDIIDFEAGLEHSKDHKSWTGGLFFYCAKSSDLHFGTTKPNMKANGIKSAFPFSWAVINLLDGLCNINTGGASNLLEVFSENSLAKVINEVTDENTPALKCFAKDLLLAKAKFSEVLTVELQDVLINSLIAASRKTFLQRINNDEEDVVRKMCNSITVVDIYSTHLELYKRINTMLEIIMAKPDVYETLLKKSKDKETNDKYRAALQNSLKGILQESTDFDHDNIAMLLALDSMKKFTDFNAWKVTTSKLGTIIINMSAANVAVHDKWRRLSIVKLFLDHVRNQSSNDEDLRVAVDSKLILLWSLKDIDFTNSSKTFDKIITVIKKTSTGVAEKIYAMKNADQCIVCLEAFNQPVALPCGHVGCKSCYKAIFEDKDEKFCTVEECKEKLPEDYVLRSTKECKEKVDRHAAFRNGLNTFFLDILQKHVFSHVFTQDRPHEEILRQLLDFVVHKNKTKIMSPFEADHIDPSPVIRSFVLQLFLMADFELAQDYLEYFIMDAKNLEGHSEVELCLLVLFCFEDRLLMNLKASNRKNMSTKWLKDYARQPKILNDVSVSSLLGLAKLRLALRTVGLELGKLLKDNAAAGLEGDVQNLIRLTKAAFDCDETESLKKYLVRVVIETTRKETINVWKKRTDILSSLLPEDIMTSGPDNIQDFFLFLEDSRQPYKVLRDGLRTDLMSGKLKEIPEILKRYPYRGLTKDIWDMALYFLLTVAKCPVKNGEALNTNLTKIDADLQKAIARYQNAGQIDDDKADRPMDEALKTLLWQISKALGNQPSRYFFGIGVMLSLCMH